MKKLMVAIVVTLSGLGIVTADITSDLITANAMLKSNDFANVEITCNKIIADYPDATDDQLVENQVVLAENQAHQGNYPNAITILSGITISNYPNVDTDRLKDSLIYTAYLLNMNSDFVTSIATYNSIINDYPNSSVATLSSLQSFIGNIYDYKLHQYDLAVIAYNKVISNYKTAPAQIVSRAYYNIGRCYNKLYKYDDANTALITSAFGYGFISLKHQTDCYNEINWFNLGTDKSVEYLKNLLLIIPATEENSSFLGEIKSKLQLIQ